jgi:hypothetical protein
MHTPTRSHGVLLPCQKHRQSLPHIGVHTVLTWALLWLTLTHSLESHFSLTYSLPTFLDRSHTWPNTTAQPLTHTAVHG